MKNIITKGYSASYYIKRNIPKSGFAYAGVRGDRATVALHQEFGTEDIPERSFIRSTFDERIEQIEKDIIEHRVGTAANYLAKAIIEKIDSNVPPPLAPSTVAAKGHAHSLIDTGEMRDQVGAFEEVTE